MTRFQFGCVLGFALTAMGAAQAQDLTTPEGARMIHGTIKDQILAFRQDGDSDFIYLTAILAWRCGIKRLTYSVNDDPMALEFPLEPCHRDLRDPNSFDGALSFPIYLKVPVGSIAKMTLHVVYDDGAKVDFPAERAKNLIK